MGAWLLGCPPGEFDVIAGVWRVRCDSQFLLSVGVGAAACSKPRVGTHKRSISSAPKHQSCHLPSVALGTRTRQPETAAMPPPFPTAGRNRSSRSGSTPSPSRSPDTLGVVRVQVLPESDRGLLWNQVVAAEREDRLALLNENELKILAGVASGRRCVDIAGRMQYQPKTVKNKGLVALRSSTFTGFAPLQLSSSSSSPCRSFRTRIEFASVALLRTRDWSTRTFD